MQSLLINFSKSNFLTALLKASNVDEFLILVFSLDQSTCPKYLLGLFPIIDSIKSRSHKFCH